MTDKFVLSLMVALLLFAPAAAFCCDRPRPQSIRQFYKVEKFGQLGIKDLGQNVRILDQYKCYDLSFLRNKNLQIYFNNAQDNSDEDPTYVGALIMRVFSSKDEGEPFSAYLYRNFVDEDATSFWGHKASGKADVGTAYSSAEMTVVNDYYNADEKLPAKDLTSLNSEARKNNSDVAKRLASWHALIMAKLDQGYVVHEDTAAAADKWFSMPVTPPTGTHYSILRAYLTKYRPSKTGRAKPFFSSGARSADCVYIKLIASGDRVRSFGIETRHGNRDFIALKMRSEALCEAP